MDNMIKALGCLKSEHAHANERELKPSSDSPDQKRRKRIKVDEEANNMNIHASQLVPDLDSDQFKSDEKYGKKIVQLVVLFILKASYGYTVQ